MCTALNGRTLLLSDRQVGEQVEEFLFDKGIGGPSQKNAGSHVRPPIMRLSSHADEPTL